MQAGRPRLALDPRLSILPRDVLELGRQRVERLELGGHRRPPRSLAAQPGAVLGDEPDAGRLHQQALQRLAGTSAGDGDGDAGLCREIAEQLEERRAGPGLLGTVREVDERPVEIHEDPEGRVARQRLPVVSGAQGGSSRTIGVRG